MPDPNKALARGAIHTRSEDSAERVFRQGCIPLVACKQTTFGRSVRYAFVAEHRGQFSVRAMCKCLRIQPSGFYAWLKAPLSKRAQDDERQTKLLRTAWTESGKVYGYRKLHDDLLPSRDIASRCPAGQWNMARVSVRTVSPG